ncbi:hypothetical protein AAFF_G00001740 [Aldrovandia affinis]|uniref:Essential protein Yae1 N-terminal domain-containing protein n=1 Tax=Aldrovandia affinis TaxID=143900 RepID=A0AAD7TD68_9TELE|nr:hypothetical protein AAFF_G00001740 [Aldrovandia affinis]
MYIPFLGSDEINTKTRALPGFQLVKSTEHAHARSVALTSTARKLGGEDVFDEDGDDITLQSKEWKLNMEKRAKDGYRDGADAGKEASLQIGFNRGYREGADKMVAIGQLKGVVSALQSWCQLHHPGSATLSSVSQLLQNVVRHEEGLIERMRMAQQTPASVGMVTECIDDLSVEPTDTGCGGGNCSGQDCCKKEQGQEGDSTSPQTPCQSSPHPSFSAEESLEPLRKSCMDLVMELGLSEELVFRLAKAVEAQTPIQVARKSFGHEFAFAVSFVDTIGLFVFGSDESGRNQAGVQEKDLNSTHESSRKAGSDAQLDTGMTAVQVNHEVSSEVRKAEEVETSEDGCPDDLSPKAEEGHIADHTHKHKQGNVEDEKSGNVHLGYPVHKMYVLVEDPPKVEDVQVDIPSKKAESGPSPKPEDFHPVDPSLKSEPIEMEDPLFKSEPTESVDPSIKSESVEVADPSFKSETVEVADPSIKSESVEVADPSFKSETVEVADPSFKSESVEVADISFKSESVEVADPSFKTESVEVADIPFKSESVEVADIPFKSESVEVADPSFKSESVEVADVPFKSESVKVADPSFKSESVEVANIPFKSESVEVADVSLKSRFAQLEETQDIKAEDQTLNAVDGPTEDPSLVSYLGRSSLSQEPQMDRGPTAVVPDEAFPPTAHNALRGNLSSPEHVEEAESVSGTHHPDGQLERDSHGGEGDTQLRGATDVNDDSPSVHSSNQAKMPTDELATRKSDIPKGDIVQDVEEEVRKDEGGEEKTDEEEEEGDASKVAEASGKGEMMERNGPTETQTQEECTNQGSPLIVEVKMEPVKCEAGIDIEEQANSDEDLYRGAEEIAMERSKQGKTEPLIQITLPGVQDRSSVAPGVDILSYSQREWKGNTAKSALIKKGYAELSCSFENLRRVRGDNYCALRATLFQVLSESDKLPALIQDDDITLLPEKIVAEVEQIESWRFPFGHNEGAIEQLKHHLKLLQRRWQAAAQAGSTEERQRLCEPIFQDGEEEHALLEALKFLMLSAAVELHARMQRGDDVPIFCWLLFARDTSDCPAAFLTNHLSHVGFSGGLEQVEMFLLGYALQLTIQVYRLYKADTEEFITYYPDDHKEDWPHVCLVTEDDRHYNVPVGKLKGLQLPEATNSVGLPL